MILITQPTYLPWIGYFSFIDKADEIIFLDDVQFSKRSWQQRNKILLNNYYHYLTVPVKSKGRRDQLIKEVEINKKLFFNEHLKVVKHAYSKAPYFRDVYNILQNLSEQISNEISLSKINILLIKNICKYLKIELKYSQSSEYNIKKKKTAKIAELCKYKMNFELMSNEGTINYMVEDIDILKKNKINVTFYKFKNIEYNQITKQFIKQLSILDLIFNEGPNSINIIRDGLKKIEI